MSERWPHPSTLPVERLLEDCEVQRTRRSGPGGQHRNRVESAIVIRHRPTGIVVEAGERRSQEQNRRVAVGRLRMKLAVEHREPVEPERQASALWGSRCRAGRIVCSLQHTDFPSLLAEALDVLDAHDLDIRTAAERLGCTSSQLVRFIRSVPAAFQIFNRARQVRGLKAMR